MGGKGEAVEEEERVREGEGATVEEAVWRGSERTGRSGESNCY
jgi:hypothetical protein